MKGMKKILMVLMVLSMIVVFAGPASSASWYDVAAVWTSVNDVGDVVIRVENLANGQMKNFALPTDQANQMLAMVFTLQASGDALSLKIEADNWNAGIITDMRLWSASP